MDTPGGSYTPPTTPTAGGSKPEQLVYPAKPPKDPILVMVLNLLILGGVGYIVMGQKTKGIVAIAAWVIGLCSFGILSGIVSIVAAIDGYMQAQQLQAGHPVGQWTFFQDHK
jgi:hypothetical protein